MKLPRMSRKREAKAQAKSGCRRGLTQNVSTQERQPPEGGFTSNGLSFRTAE